MADEKVMTDPRDALIAELHRSGLPDVMAQQRRRDAICAQFGCNTGLMAAEIDRLREENEALRHDIARLIQAATDEANA